MTSQYCSPSRNTKKLLFLALKFPVEGFYDWKEDDSQKVFDPQAFELTEDLEEVTAFSEPEDEEYSDAVMQRPQLTTSVMKKGLQLADKLVDHLFNIGNFTDRCLRYKMKTVRELSGNCQGTYKCLYRNMQKKAKQSRITSFFIKFCISSPTIQSTSFDHPENFQRRKPITFH
jgi:hypothetical protein